MLYKEEKAMPHKTFMPPLMSSQVATVNFYNTKTRDFTGFCYTTKCFLFKLSYVQPPFHHWWPAWEREDTF